MRRSLWKQAWATVLASCAVAGCSFDVDGLVMHTAADAGSSPESAADASEPVLLDDAGGSAVSMPDADDAGPPPEPPTVDAMTASDASSDAGAVITAQDAGPEPLPRFQAPQPFVAQGLQSPQDPTLTGDQLELLVHDLTPATASDIFARSRTSTSSAFGEPAPLPGINSSAEDISPELARDGLELWFASNRSGVFRAYRSARQARGAGWSSPVLVDFGLGSTFSVSSVTPAPDGMTVILCLSTATTKKLYLSQRLGQAWSVVTPITLAGWSDTSMEAGGMLDERGRLWFASDLGVPGDSKMYYAEPVAYGSFAAPVAFEAANVAGGAQRDPWISVDGRELFFTHTDATGNHLMHTRALQ